MDRFNNRVLPESFFDKNFAGGTVEAGNVKLRREGGMWFHTTECSRCLELSQGGVLETVGGRNVDGIK